MILMAHASVLCSSYACECGFHSRVQLVRRCACAGEYMEGERGAADRPHPFFPRMWRPGSFPGRFASLRDCAAGAPYN
jgi:hypothetical protein